MVKLSMTVPLRESTYCTLSDAMLLLRPVSIVSRRKPKSRYALGVVPPDPSALVRSPTLQAGLGKAYTEEVAAAYTAMWGVVEATMLAGYPPKKPADAYPVKS